MILDAFPAFVGPLGGESSGGRLSLHFASLSVVGTVSCLRIVFTWTSGTTEGLIDRYKAVGADEPDVSDLLFEQFVFLGHKFLEPAQEACSGWGVNGLQPREPM